MKLDKRELERLYIDKKLSTWAIERLTGKPRSSIYRHLKESGVKIRNIAESHIRHKRNPFKGSIYIGRRNNQAVISWGNYNHVLIAKIRNNLQRLGIKISSIICDHLKGYRGQDGY